MEASATDGVQTFQLDLPLQCGRVLRGATVAYETRGNLSAAKDNVILHPTSFDATSSDLMYNVGPGQMLDTDRYHGMSRLHCHLCTDLCRLLTLRMVYSDCCQPAGQWRLNVAE
jgi:hypothetical protein